MYEYLVSSSSGVPGKGAFWSTEFKGCVSL